jgi:phosphohistidine phosphatase
MIVYFLRHANAGQKKLNPKKDEKRPLDDEGIRQCTQMGRMLSAMDVAVDAVISSPLKRATQTAALVANEIGYEGKLHIEDALRPEAKYENFRDMMRNHAKHEAVMVVGHNPNFSSFLGHFISQNGERANVEMKKGSVARVESKQKKMVLHWMITPRVARAAADAEKIETPPRAELAAIGAGAAATPLAAPVPAKRAAQQSKPPKDKKPKGRKKRKKHKGGKKRPQPEALTTSSRPKTSRK